MRVSQTQYNRLQQTLEKLEHIDDWNSRMNFRIALSDVMSGNVYAQQ